MGLHLSMENATDAMIVIDVMDHPKRANSVNKNALLTKRTRMENFCAGSVPCPTKGLWSGQNNPTLPDIVEFSKRTKKRKRRKKKSRGTNISITKNRKDLMLLK